MSPRAKYKPVVTTFLPGCHGKELELRASLLLLRDNSQRHLSYCSEQAHSVLTEINRLAALYAYESMKIEALEALRHTLVKMITVASELEMFARDLGGTSGEDE